MTRHTSTQKSLAAGVTWPHPTTWGWGSTILSRAQKGRNESQLSISIWIVVLEKTLESPLDCKEIQSVHSEGDQPWDFSGRNDAKAETPVLWPPHAKSWLIGRLWCWEGLGARGKGDDRGWDGQMASLTRWTWVWVNSRSWWWTGRPGVLRFMGRKESDTTERLNWTELNSHQNVSCAVVA